MLNKNLLTSPDSLYSLLDDDNLLIVDLCDSELYAERHIPGAVHLERSRLIYNDPPAKAKLPPVEQILSIINDLGIRPGKKVVAYDNSSSMWATRLLWTLEMAGHTNYSLLNGGIQKWIAARYPVKSEVQQKSVFDQSVLNPFSSFMAEARMEREEIEKRLSDSNLIIWDARSAGEYTGEICRSARGGHIPGAIHLEWSDLLDPDDYFSLRKDAETILLNHGISREKEILTYCHGHMRSSVTWFAGKFLGYPSIKAYDGAWSEWGNLPDTPVEK